MAHINAVCCACSNELDLLSVNEELSLDRSLWLQNNAADLVKYCFSIKMVKVDVPNSICSACLGVLIQASSFKEKILLNIDLHKGDVDTEKNNRNEIDSRDFKMINGNSDSRATEYRWKHPEIVNHSDNQKSDEELKTRKALVAKKEQLINEINSMSGYKIKINKSEYDTTNESDEILKRSDSKKPIKKDHIARSFKKKKELKSKKSVRFNVLLKHEFQSLRRNCKDFGLFSWFRSEFKCAVCKKLFADKSIFKTHAKKHKNKDFDNVYPKGNLAPDLKVDISSMKCRHCGVRVTEVDAFRSHLFQTHNIQNENLFEVILPFNLTEDEVKCGICSLGFKNITPLNIHMNEHSSNFACVHCGKRYISLRRLKNHVRNIHMTGTFKCSQCDETFETIAKRGYHMARIHSGIQHLCQHCPQSFKNFILKVRHLAEVHNETLKKYKCENCPSTFTTCVELSLHVRRIHLHERNHKCSMCEYSFFNIQELRDHIITHTGEKSFVCKVCNKALGRKRTLIEHMRIHNDERRHACQYCKRSFVHQCSLKAHLKTHKNDLK